MRPAATSNTKTQAGIKRGIRKRDRSVAIATDGQSECERNSGTSMAAVRTPIPAMPPRPQPKKTQAQSANKFCTWLFQGLPSVALLIWNSL